MCSVLVRVRVRVWLRVRVSAVWCPRWCGGCCVLVWRRSQGAGEGAVLISHAICVYAGDLVFFVSCLGRQAVE